MAGIVAISDALAQLINSWHFGDQPRAAAATVHDRRNRIR
jgi:hypothetical protein